jgi:18S rRNA (guanine1575-N7)-methyltransferase
MLADLGCGSGLSCAALQQRTASAAWVGLDVTPEMLRIAAQQPSRACLGHLAVADLGQGLPLRALCLDGAISISAVQVSPRCWDMHGFIHAL